VAGPEVDGEGSYAEVMVHHREGLAWLQPFMRVEARSRVGRQDQVNRTSVTGASVRR
jgi:hypothetical protein